MAQLEQQMPCDATSINVSIQEFQRIRNENGWRNENGNRNENENENGV